MCVTREGKRLERLDSGKEARLTTHTPLMLKNQEVCETLKESVLSSVPVKGITILRQITEAEKLGDCILDFHI